MDISLRNKLIDVLSSSSLRKEDATFVADVLQDIDMRKQEMVLTQKDKAELIDRMNVNHQDMCERVNHLSVGFTTKLYLTVFSVGLVQLLAIIGAVLTIINAGKS